MIFIIKPKTKKNNSKTNSCAAPMKNIETNGNAINQWDLAHRTDWQKQRFKLN